jgi:hypothetical protein
MLSRHPSRWLRSVPLGKVWRLRRLCAGLTFVSALVSSTAFADVIYLKNGRKIVAEFSREDAKQLFLVREEGEFRGVDARLATAQGDRS